METHMKKEYKICLFILAVSAMLPVIFLFLLISENERIEKISLADAEKINNVSFYRIEDAEIIEEKEVYVSGRLKEPTTDGIINRNIILVKDSEAYRLNTSLTYWENLIARKSTGNHYENSQMEANGAVKYLEEGTYQIGFLLEESSTKRYFVTDKCLEVP